jgi:hypothetical protein
LRARYDAGRIAAVRAAYTGVSGRRSDAPGFAGMVEEMRRGLAELTPEDRARADERVLEAIFFAPLGLRVLRVLRTRLHDVTARTCARAAPLLLAWLVGDVERRGRRVDVVRACTFRRDGGEELCEHVCRRPTERFSAARAMPVRLAPDRGSLACTWTWGDDR